MDEKYVKVDDIVEYCNTYSVYLQGKGQGVAQCALRRVKEFAKENAADVQPVNKWISVKDRLPEIGKSVLIYYPKWDGDEIQVAKLEGDGMMFDICGEFNIGTGVITHWMPLPEPPKDGDSK